MMDEQSI